MRAVRRPRAAKSVTSIVTFALALGFGAAATFAISAHAAPPAPVITKHPVDPSTNTTVTFAYKDAKPVSGFRCALDTAALKSCPRTGRTLKRVGLGRHCFRVVAVGTTGALSKATTFCWYVVVTIHLPIGTEAGTLLAPGVALPVNLKFTNPYAFKIKIVSVAINVLPATKKAGHANPLCNGPKNLTLDRAFKGPVTVPAHSVMTLANLGVPVASWPLLQMPDLATNQDACKDTNFTFAYSELATK